MCEDQERMDLLRGNLSMLFVALVTACSPSIQSGLTKQEIQDITSVILKQTTNHLFGLQRESNGDVTVSTAPLDGGTNDLGTMFTVRRLPEGWVVVSQKNERFQEQLNGMASRLDEDSL